MEPDLLVVGRDREPWRWTPALRRTGWAGLSLLVALAFLGLYAGHGRRHSTSAPTVLLRADDLDTVAASGRHVRLALRNAGSVPVTLVSARLLAPGYGEQRVEELMGPGDETTLRFADTAVCGPQLLDHLVGAVRVRVRTSRGGLMTRDVTLGPAGWNAVNHAARARCGYLAPDEAFVFVVRSTRLSGGELVLRATTADASLLPLTIRDIGALPGLSVAVSPALPLRLPVRSGGVVHRRELTLRLRVSDCAALSRGGLQIRSDSVLGSTVLRQDSMWVVPITLNDTFELPQAVLRLLTRSC